MNKVHIVVGDNAALALKTAFDTIDGFGDELFVVKDVLSLGPLRSEELPFSALRSAFWQEVSGNEVEVDDLERLMDLSTRSTNDTVQQIWFWMSGLPADVCTYFWLLHFLKKHMGKFFVVNINGLPFLDQEGKLFYPESIAALPPKQVLKAMKLSRAVTPSEWETDGEEWKRSIQEKEVGIRISGGGKQLIGKAIDHYDQRLLELAGTNNQKLTKLVTTAMQKYKIFTGDTFLIWRLAQLAGKQLLTITKDNVKLYSGMPTDASELFNKDKTAENG